jgi:membrane-bound metal-dependent hydrolase YbcI (DUF457 family)
VLAGICLFAGIVVLLTLVLHPVVDALTPMGIQSWTPRSNQTISFELFTAANSVTNYALLGIGYLSICRTTLQGLFSESTDL